MGEVFLAEDTRLRRRVALKAVTTRHAARPEARQRLLREARAAAALNHPNIAAIYDVIETDGDMHIVMEYVEGTSLDEVVRRGPLPVRRALRIGLELTDAVAAAHEHGVVHRNLKPSNIRLTSSGHVKVLDFGLARTLDADPRVPAGSDGTTAALTDVNQLVGTPAYMAPEQLRGARGDQQSDIYGLGVVLFELLTGQRPFQATSTIDLAIQALTLGVPDLRTLRPDTPSDLAAIVARATARDLRDRIASVAELRDLLRDVYEEQPPASPASPMPVPLVAQTPIATPPQTPLPVSTSQPALPQAPWWSWQTAWARVGYRAMAALMAIGLVAFAVSRFRAVPSPSEPVTPTRALTVAVLPVSVPPGSSELQAAAAGIGEIIATNLSLVPGLQVLPRVDTATALGVIRDVARVVRDLAPTYVVNAGVDGSSSEFRLDVNLLDAKGAVAWTRNTTAASTIRSACRPGSRPTSAGRWRTWELSTHARSPRCRSDSRRRPLPNVRPGRTTWTRSASLTVPTSRAMSPGLLRCSRRPSRRTRGSRRAGRPSPRLAPRSTTRRRTSSGRRACCRRTSKRCASTRTGRTRASRSRTCTRIPGATTVRSTS